MIFKKCQLTPVKMGRVRSLISFFFFFFFFRIKEHVDAFNITSIKFETLFVIYCFIMENLVNLAETFKTIRSTWN